MTEQTRKKSYKKTLNLPRTAFPMKANLVQNEPDALRRWDRLGVYGKLRQRAVHEGAPKGPFVVHDGPPYANGDIHLGHLLNKVLKDLVVRSRSMLGYDCPYTPGWDCHGLPIEHKVMQELGAGGAGGAGGFASAACAHSSQAADANPWAQALAPLQIRNKCAKYAEKFVKVQKGQMQRLLTLADYDAPYLTMQPRYESAVLAVFAGMIERGLVYRDLKPVHWSVDNQTALAEAELEYHERRDTSVYVKFALSRDAALPGRDGEAADSPRHLMIWTTTPWTLPANLAVAVHERYEYGLYQAGQDQVILATELAEKVLALGGIDSAQPLATFPGRELLGLEYRHPFIERVGKVVHAGYVTLADGTGLVHTAPGHGSEDYQTALREGLDIYCPVQGDGTYDSTVPDWLAGKSIWSANDEIVEYLSRSGHLFHDHRFTHSYPHDWRGKKPVIFRATEQWFIGVDRPVVDAPGDPGAGGDAGGEAQQPASPSLRDAALRAAAEQLHFLPEWGRNRMRGMLESRPDWCISRQRAWGLPIPAFFPPPGVEGDPLLTAASVRALAGVFAEKGSDAWFFMSPQELLQHYDPTNDPDAPAWITSEIQNQKSEMRTGGDTFDVWFESGSSWNAVLRPPEGPHAPEAPQGPRGWAGKQAVRADGQSFPADLYLEGSDQHRGWFQHSLLPALALTGQAPFRGVLTHGFMVDRDGRKMSKSVGNALKVDSLLKDFGADVCRWWVASLNVENDIKADPSFFKLAGEEYRKVRNTLRFLLSNLDDFDAAAHAHRFSVADARSLDAWALGQLARLTAEVEAAYEGYRFRRAAEAIFHFCNDTLSAVYLAAAKDRLYCDAAQSPRRRRTQTAMHRIAAALAKLLAPILAHTADEVWRVLHPADDDACVHLELIIAPDPVPLDEAWPTVMARRDDWLRALERHRQSHQVDNPLSLGLRVGGVPQGFDPVDLADLCGISRFEIVEDDATAIQVLDLSTQPRCERSWKRDGTVTQRSDGGMLSTRDAAALGL